MCSREFPCGNVLRRTLAGPGFVIEECLNAHTFRSGMLPVLESKNARTAAERAQDFRMRHPGTKVSRGLCRTCGQPRGRTGTANRCRPCATEDNARRNTAYLRNKREHEAATAGMKKKA